LDQFLRDLAAFRQQSRRVYLSQKINKEDRLPKLRANSDGLIKILVFPCVPATSREYGPLLEVKSYDHSDRVIVRWTFNARNKVIS